MPTNVASFSFEDLCEQLPNPGYYLSTIRTARFRRSAGGNRMLQVVHCLEGVSPPFQLLADYFVLEGATPEGISLARRRLVELYRACGLDPQVGQQIDGGQLLQAHPLVKVEHHSWDNQMRLRVAGYRAPWPSDESALGTAP